MIGKERSLTARPAQHRLSRILTSLSREFTHLPMDFRAALAVTGFSFAVKIFSLSIAKLCHGERSVAIHLGRSR